MSLPDPHERGGAASEHLLLYDGVCGLCSRVIAFVLPRDVHGRFAFASLQSPTGQSVLSRSGRAPNELTTVYVVRNYRSPSPELLSKSRAALFVLTTLGGFWRAFGMFRALPVRLLDAGYDLVARNRYRIFGRFETCLLPEARYRNRFIDV